MLKKVVTAAVLILTLGLGYALRTATTPQLVVEKEVEKIVEQIVQIEIEVTPTPTARERSDAFVLEHLPASRYVTNDFLPADPYAPWEALECGGVYEEIEIGMPWIFNDEPAPWYNAIEMGYDKDVCLKFVLVKGGPGAEHLKGAAAGAVDVAVQPGGNTIPKLVGSRTPADVVAIGTFLKDNPYGWLGIDWDIPQGQQSTKVLEPEDFVGKTIGIQPDSKYIVDYITEKYGLPAGGINVVKGGFLPDPLILKEWDAYGAWIMNQPRLLEMQGYMNWTFFQFSTQADFHTYSDVSAVTRKTLEERPEMVRGYLAATCQGIRYMLEHPDESADIAVRYAWDLGEYELSREMALRRFELQRDLVVGYDGTTLMRMTEAQWNGSVQQLYRYGQIEIHVE